MTEMPEFNALSDLVVIVLGLSGPVAAIVGYLVGYFGPVKIAERNARHDERQRALDRRIAARQEWLLPFQRSIGSTMQAADDARTAKFDYLVVLWQEEISVRAGHAPGTVVNTPGAVEAKSAWDEKYRIYSQLSKELKKLRFVNGDGTLHSLIEQFNQSARDVEDDLMNAAAAVIDSASSTDEVRKNAEAAHSAAYVKLYDIVRPINKRIEELLEGKELTP